MESVVIWLGTRHKSKVGGSRTALARRTNTRWLPQIKTQVMSEPQDGATSTIQFLKFLFLTSFRPCIQEVSTWMCLKMGSAPQKWLFQSRKSSLTWMVARRCKWHLCEVCRTGAGAGANSGKKAGCISTCLLQRILLLTHGEERRWINSLSASFESYFLSRQAVVEAASWNSTVMTRRAWRCRSEDQTSPSLNILAGIPALCFKGGTHDSVSAVSCLHGHCVFLACSQE